MPRNRVHRDPNDFGSERLRVDREGHGEGDSRMLQFLANKKIVDAHITRHWVPYGKTEFTLTFEDHTRLIMHTDAVMTFGMVDNAQARAAQSDGDVIDGEAWDAEEPAELGPGMRALNEPDT